MARFWRQTGHPIGVFPDEVPLTVRITTFTLRGKAGSGCADLAFAEARG